MSTDAWITIAAMTGFAALSAFASWRANQPVRIGVPRLLPWRGIIIFSGFFAILALVHLINLAGVETGRQ
ncbi:MAG: hypothetical protein NW203_04475 [Hyphomonadaceae bacterium]|nr:hypothetical protein [Hyphomonadaceae bacterium]